MSGKPAARVTDPTACPLPGHGTNPITAGSPNVLFDGLPAARQGDPSACGSAMSSGVIPNVLINGKPAAVQGSVGSHGNVVVGGSGTVIIGTSHSPATLVSPAPLNIFSFDARVQLLDSISGKPLKNIPYIATLADGSETRGVTNELGISGPLGKSSQPQNVQFIAKPNWLLRGE